MGVKRVGELAKQPKEALSTQEKTLQKEDTLKTFRLREEAGE